MCNIVQKGIFVDRLVGIQDLRSKDYFLTRALEHILISRRKVTMETIQQPFTIWDDKCVDSPKKIIGIIDEKKKDDDDEESEAKNRRVRSSTAKDSDSD
ncbi:Thioredoxin domain-containing protein PLP3B [Zea mays]|uniref:Thioredoxin domain-containing protein PLP3B n=1 Tax=Zea mays TaxID=4577 RepID=A0A1D6FJC0_MAIZE|nr:Thioredoxin domain-containing protein PLP3B [Zea mays]ONM27472.1 Thioredoxin domain-containing protein PLP3B [Zea mays]